MSKFKFWLLNTIFRKDKKVMVVIYATLIIRGSKTLSEVPTTIRDKVKQMLIDLDCPELAEI